MLGPDWKNSGARLVERIWEWAKVSVVGDSFVVAAINTAEDMVDVLL